MRVHVVIPVYNRLSQTQSLIACLSRQVVELPLNIIVVDDGSTDGTSVWLAEQNNIEVLQGNGYLFWGGAVDLALHHLYSIAAPEDWLLLMNNDTTITENFVQELLDIAMANAPAAVGSVIRDEADPESLLSIGVRLDSWRLVTKDVLDCMDMQKLYESDVINVDALSGRGVIFPFCSIISAGGMRPNILPHYLADYELSLRVKNSGYKLLISLKTCVYSKNEYGSLQQSNSLRNKFFTTNSPSYLPAFIAFWWAASNWLEKITLPIRLLSFRLFAGARKSH